jgi:hypothetical protein
MGERIRSLMGKSSSKLGISKGSMNHIGTTPYKYKVSLFISHIDGITTAGEVCVTMERHGKNESTSVVKVKDKKAVFRETLSMETTLFRRQTGPGKVGGSPVESEDIKFDEKIAKIALRKGNAEGKSLGKIHLNLADYIKGPTGTVFADIKLSNDSIIVSKIESELLQMGKKKKNGDDDSEVLSDTTERDTGMDNDSIFGDHVEEKDDLDLMISDVSSSQPNPLLNASSKPSMRTTPTNQNKERPSTALANDDKILAGGGYGEIGGRTLTQTDDKPGTSFQSSLGLGYGMPRSEESDASSSSLPSSNAQNTSIPYAKGGQHSPNEVSKGAIDEANSKTKKDKGGDDKNPESLASSPSLRNRLKAKLKRDKTSKKEPGQSEGKEAGTSPTAVTQNAFSTTATEIAELRLALDAAQSENKKLKASKQALMTEIDELRSEIEANEEQSTDVERRGQGVAAQKFEGMRSSNENLDVLKANKDLQDKVYMLENEIEVLRDGPSGKEIDTSERERASMLKVKTYERKIEDLEVALRREPQYLDVVDELKVTKMALALANMEREQALFALKQYESAASSNSNAINPGWTLF